jgi:DNA-binding transcriptional regulator YiaG
MARVIIPVVHEPMSTVELKLVMVKLRLSSRRAGRLLGADESTVRVWRAGKRAVPKQAALILRWLVSGEKPVY